MSRRLSRHLILIGAVAATTVLTAQTTPAGGYDVIIRGGTVLDGTGQPRFAADVGIVRGTIAKVGVLAGQTAPTVIDATGLYVAPGFINIHSHATPEGLQRAENMLAQGVTTEIINADGGGPTELDPQLHRLRIAGLAVNVGANIGFNAIWAEVMGPADKRPSTADVDTMRELVRRGLEQGAYGVSAGLDYKPGYYATAEEVGRVVEVARPWRTIFPNHDRLTPESGYSSRVGVAETIAIAGRSGLVPVVTHMKAQGREQGTAAALLKMMDEAAAKGTYVAADVYPYLAGQSGLAALIIPGWALDGGREAMLKRFANPQDRARIVKEAEEAMQARFGGPQGVYATGHKKELVDAMKEFGVTSPGEALVRLLEQSDGGAILRFGVESDLVAILKHPNASVACDCGAITGDAAHPRYYGTFPRVLGRYVREQQALTWEDAIRKMTGLPAATVGMINRGFIAPGMAADIAIFDSAAILDRATFEAPTEMPVGMRHVLVNGKLAFKDGAVTGERAGAVLLRGPHEPSRPMRPTLARKVSGKLGGSEIDVNLNVEQGPGQRAPRGRFKMLDRTSKTTFELTEPGALHVAKGWAAVVGFGKIGNEQRAIAVIVEAADPLDERGYSTITVLGEDGFQLSRIVPSNSLKISPR
ncbi:MAG TPA: amidohydrolase family protein [Vicinamibacterales bacterium]|nr:amidohydrolase family protein [Vicinamibacterales bacterium]